MALLIRDLALADGTSDPLQLGLAIKIEDGHIAWLGPTEEADPNQAEVIDGGDATLVPGLVDCHSHLTGPGGSHWIERFSDRVETLRHVGRDNARRLVQAGVLWSRDVGAPTVNGRPVNLELRDELRGLSGQPYIRAAGTWVAKAGYLPNLTIDVTDGASMRAASLVQLDGGADFVKLILDAPGGESGCPFSVDDVRGTVEAVRARGRRITAHATYLEPARVAATAGVDSIEHGIWLDDDIARTMATNNVTLVSTLSVLASFETFERTSRIERFTSDEAKNKIQERKEQAFASIASAEKAGVRIATGSDFGGGSVRAGHLAWEVELLVKAGLEPWQALAAATCHGGELLDEPTAGRIGVGGPADFVLVHGDPLSDPATLWRVWSVYQRGTRVA